MSQLWLVFSRKDSESLCDELATRKLPSTLEELISLVICQLHFQNKLYILWATRTLPHYLDFHANRTHSPEHTDELELYLSWRF